MIAESVRRTSKPRGRLGRGARAVVQVLWPTQRLLWTREGVGYLAVWIVLLFMGMKQQINLILMVAALAAGPVAASFLVSAVMLRKLRAARRVPPYAFATEPFSIDYALENDRRFSAALALPSWPPLIASSFLVVSCR